MGSAGAATSIDKGTGKDHSFGESGFNDGVNLGFTRELGSNGWLWGAEVGISTLNVDKSKSDAVLGKPKLEASGLAEGLVKLGYGWDKLHLYGMAGLAVSDVKVRGSAKKSDDYRAGFAYGVGAEYALSDVWSTKVEVLGYDFGEEKIKFNGTERNVELGAGVVRLGLSRKF